MRSFDLPQHTDCVLTMDVDPRMIASVQAGYCNENDYPLFAPWDGTCYRCGRNIYEGQSGFDYDYANNNLISYCPYCHYSFVE